MSFIKLGCNVMYYGEGAIHSIEELQGLRRKAFIVMSGDILKQVGSFQLVIDHLEKAGFSWQSFEDVEAEPSFQTVLKGAEQMNKFEPDWIIGFGGGSAMDAAKAMWVFYENTGYQTLEDATSSKGIEKLREKARLCCIPTSAGTGSEATRAALIKDTVQKRKYSIRDMKGRMIPDVAILDPIFTKTMPKSLIASCGMDTITHAIESYTCPIANPFSKSMALGSLLYGYHALPRLYQNNNIKDGEAMLASSCMGGIAFSNSALGIVHSIAHTFGAEYGIPHGLANAITLPYGIAFNQQDEEVSKQYDELAYMLHEDSLIDAIVKLKKELNIPNCMRQVVENEDQFLCNLDALCVKAMHDVCTPFTPLMPTDKTLKELILQVYYGKTSVG